MLTGIRRVMRAGFVGFWRNAYVSIASVFVITIALLVVGSSMFVDQLLTTSLQNLQEKVDINVYFVTNAPQADIDAILIAVEALPDVSEVIYTSREEALTDYRERRQGDEISLRALEELGDNPLGAKLSIKAKETSQYENIARFLVEQQSLESSVPVIDEINYLDNKPAIDTLTRIIDATEQTGFVIMIVLLVAATLITLNTIRLAIYTSREEISIMRLVGAGNMFIRGPFMFQGIMYGLIAGLLSLIIFYPIMVYLGPITETFFEFNILTYFISNFSYISMVLIGSGVILGLVSSTLAVARYLRI